MSAAPAFLNDFPDSLSPMVVKELRQGLRTRAFTGTLLGLHALLILASLLSSASLGGDRIRWVYDGIATLVLCLALPMRAVNALADEVKHNTLDMLRLTGLGSSRIVFGKWAAISLQCLLMAVSLLPYLAARYLIGGLELGTELLLLGGKLLGGVVLAAALVALSTIRQAALRMLLVFVPVFFGSFGLLGYLITGVMGGPGRASMMVGGMPSWGAMAGLLAVSAWCVFSFLSLAATRISPPAEPLSWIKRPVHLAAMLLPVLLWLATGEKGLLALVTPVLCILALDAMTEPLNHIPTAYAPFYKRGLPGRVAMLFLAPGWASGFWLTLIGAGIAGLLMAFSGEMAAVPYFFLSACTAWMACVVVQVLPTRRSEDLLPVLLGTLLAIWLLVAMLGGLGLLGARASGSQPWFLALLPAAAMVGAQSFHVGPERDSFLRLSMFFAAAWPLVLGILSILSWRALAGVRKEAAELALFSGPADPAKI